MLNFTKGDIKPKSIKAWLRKSEAKLTISQLCNEVNPKKTPATSSSTVYYVDENVDQHDESYDQEAEEIETFLAEYDGDQQGPGPDDSLSEGEAVEVLAVNFRNSWGVLVFKVGGVFIRLGSIDNHVK